MSKLCIFGFPDYQLQLETFEQVDGDWFLTLHWQAPKKAIQLREGKQGLQKDSIWVGESLALVPTLRSFFETNLGALKIASKGAGSFLFDLQPVPEVENVND
jgi:hypothetical protein